METLIQDIRHAVRLLTQSPAFTVVAIATLALGIGANTAIFSVVNSVLLQPLPYSEPDRLVRLGLKFPGGVGQSVSVPKFMAWKENTHAFEYICLYDFAGPGMNVSGGSMPEQVKGIHVSADFFPVFDAKPAIGRLFSASEDQPGGPRLAVMSHALWRRRFGGDPGALGKVLVLNGEAYTVIGVLGPSFRSYPPSDLFLPLQIDPNTTNQGHYLSAAARLKPGVTLQEAQAQMKVAAERFRRANPGVMNKDESATAVLFQESMVGNIKQSLLILLGAVALVLLIACANVANLLLARAMGRAREIAIRSALGAGRWRLIRQLLTESVVLSMAGGTVGLLTGMWGARVLVALRPGNLPRGDEFADARLLDWRILAFTAAIALLTGILFGFFPALQISRTDVNSTIKESGSRSGTGRHHWMRDTLVVSETALAVVLLIGAALLIRTYASLREVNPGFNPSHVLTFETSLGGANYSATTQVDRLNKEVVRRLAAVPGVTATANVPFLPLEGGFGLGFDIVGRALNPGEQSTGGAGWMYVSDQYFKALEIPLRRGRLFDARDTAGSPGVVIINEAFAKKYWPKASPLGERIVIGKGMGPDFTDSPREVVGVIGDVKEGGLGNPAPEVMYIPLSQVRDTFMTLNNKIIPMSWVVKTAMEPLALTAAVKRQVILADGRLAISHVRSLDQVVSEATARESFNMTLLGVFAGIALLLASIGIYGMLSYLVRQRAQEIGIRMALGAQSADVQRMVVGQGMKLAGIGIAGGLAGALGLARLLTSLLYGVKANDPWVFAAVGFALGLIALAACWIPAQRATKIDPLIALRYE